MSKDIPESVLDAFPILQGKVPVRQLASPVPLVPDTTFDIFIMDSRDFFALVSTDYADPYDQSRELKQISGQYGFEFEHLIEPFSDKVSIEVSPHDEMSGTFFVTAPHKKYRLYYYLASLKTDSDD